MNQDINENYDPQCGDFDPYSCWENVDCSYVEEQCFGNIDDETFEEILYCAAPPDFVCPLYKMKVKCDLDLI